MCTYDENFCSVPTSELLLGVARRIEAVRPLFLEEVVDERPYCTLAQATTATLGLPHHVLPLGLCGRVIDDDCRRILCFQVEDTHEVGRTAGVREHNAKVVRKGAEELRQPLG